MKATHDLSQLNWTLSGWTPSLWRLDQTMEIGASPNADVSSIPARVPGSVQAALREQSIIPDWNVGLQARECEWVENRQWAFEANIPDEWIGSGNSFRLRCDGLDYNGWVYVNRTQVGQFEGSFIPYVFDITSALKESGNVVRIIFDLPPRWLGQFGFTSEMKEWKPRFNYTWDWVVRLVQIGIWDTISIEESDGSEISEFRCYTETDSTKSTGAVKVVGQVAGDKGSLRITLSRDGNKIREEEIPASQFNSNGASLKDIPVELWWTNLQGNQPLYELTCVLLAADGKEQDSVTRKIGFRKITWAPCEGAPAEADPWICVVNGKPMFLQGANWTPIHPNFADTTEEDYRKRLQLYKDLGFNLLRVWGGAALERECFYNMCDEMGLLVWQEFPLSSSGCENYPPDEEKCINELCSIAQTYVSRRQHHPSLVIWCGGNELTYRNGKPVCCNHPLMECFKNIVERDDPTRRFQPSSSCGPEFGADPANYGKGLHWDVHGPWKCGGDLATEWNPIWAGDDSLLRSETGAPGASSVEIIMRSCGDLDPWPVTVDSLLWKRGSNWWVESGQFAVEYGREPNDLQEYVAWSQERQKKALVTAVSACKNRFPRCGGIIIWMGHDCYPCNANTAIIDVDGNPKPAAFAIGEIFRNN